MFSKVGHNLFSCTDDVKYMIFNDSIEMNTLFWFSENIVWQLNKKKPAFIRDVFPGMENDIDAALLYNSSDVYFFKDSRCWRYEKKLDSFHLHSGYPRCIKEDFPGIPFNIDTATRWPYPDGNIYFFKGKSTCSKIWSNLCKTFLLLSNIKKLRSKTMYLF